MNMKNCVFFVFLFLLIFTLSACSRSASESVKADSGIDVDLTNASAAVVLSQVNNMYVEPWNYNGSVIRIRGNLNFYADTAGQEICMVMVQDATACCGQGLEFICKQDETGGSYYPNAGDEVVVTGRFEIYQNDGYSGIHLVDADLEWEHL